MPANLMTRLLTRVPVLGRLGRALGALARSWRKAAAGRRQPSGGRTALPLAPPRDTFCVHPWVHLEAYRNGEAKLCCKARGMISEGGAPMSTATHSLEEIWNSEYLRGVRLALSEGRPVADCAACYQEEKAGGFSLRMHANASWQAGWLNGAGRTVEALKAEARAGGGRLASGPSYLGLDVSTLCNLKCRMCHSELSSRIALDPVHDAWCSDQWSGNAYHDPAAAAARPPGGVRGSVATDLLRKELPYVARHVEFLFLCGGETLLSKETAAALQTLIDAGAAPNIAVLLQTNGTVVNAPALRLATRFKHLVLGLSIDGFGPYYDYIRYPARWDTLTANLRTLLALPNTTPRVNVTVQAYNALNLVDLFRYLDSLGIDFYAYQIQHPKYLHLSVLPPRARRLAAGRLRAYAESDCRPEYRALVRGLAAEVEAAGDRIDGRLVRDFMLFTNDLDAGRGQSFARTHRELLELFAADGFPWTAETLHAGR